jgi:cytidylate kinase
VDEEQRIYGKENDDFVLDAHLGFHFVPDSIRICLICDLEEAARRILDDSGRTTESATNIKDSIDSSQQRRDTMHKNFLSLYQVDIDDHSNFDLVLDTSRLTSVEVFEKVTDFIDSLST